MHIRTFLVIVLGLVALACAVAYRLMVVTVTFDVYVITGGFALAGVLILLAAVALECTIRQQKRVNDQSFSSHL